MGPLPSSITKTNQPFDYPRSKARGLGPSKYQIRKHRQKQQIDQQMPRVAYDRTERDGGSLH